MKIDKYSPLLTRIGLRKNESLVYLAALSLGPTTVLDISRATGIERATIYANMESLKTRGLLREELAGFKKKYVAEDPQMLSKILENRKVELKSALPELSKFYNLQGNSETIKYYEGIESVKSVYEGLLTDIRPGADYLAISDAAQWYELDQEFFQKYIERLGKLRITIRLLLEDSPYARNEKRFEKNYNRNIKILTSGVATNLNLAIIPGRVVIHQLVPPITATVIENKNTVEMHRKLFEIIWNSTP